MIGDILAMLVESILDGFVGSSMQKHNARIARAEGRVLCALRVREGVIRGLSDVWWWSGFMKIANRWISFELTHLKVIEARPRPDYGDPDDIVGPRVPTPVFFEIRTEAALLELAVPQEDADRIGRALGIPAAEVEDTAG